MGGGLLEIAPCPNPRSRGAWGVDNTILFVPAYQGGLVRVPAAGGPVEEVLRGDLEVTSAAYFSPVWLDTKRFLIVRFASTGDAAAVAGIYIGSLGSLDLTRLVSGAVMEVAWNDSEIFMRRGVFSSRSRSTQSVAVSTVSQNDGQQRSRPSTPPAVRWPTLRRSEV